MATGTNTQRWASPSPLAGARHASAERKRASEEDVTKRYKTLFETVNPLIEGLTTRVATVEARLTAQEVNNRKELEGLNVRITAQASRVSGLYGEVQTILGRESELDVIERFVEESSKGYRAHRHNACISGYGSGGSDGTRCWTS